MAIVTPENLEHSFLQAPYSSVLSSDTLPLFITFFLNQIMSFPTVYDDVKISLFSLPVFVAIKKN